jgi:hypothetical protein
MNRRFILEGRGKISSFLSDPSKGFNQFENHFGDGNNGPIGIKSSPHEPKGK